MPKPLQYKAGSLIYAQGEKAERIFILQSGKISLVYKDLETGDDVRDQVQSGEFFGVKSALARFLREENAMVLTDSAVMSLDVPEFEALVMSNTKIVMQLLTAFSKQMRRVHEQVAKLLATEPVKPENALFDLGLQFMARKRFAHSKYVFNRYLELYPQGRDVVKAQKNLYLSEVSIVCTAEDEKPLQGKNRGAAAGGKKLAVEAPAAPAVDMSSFARFARVFKKDEIFFCEHEPGENFYLIQSGKVKLVKNTGTVERTLDVLQPPDMFGEMALLENSPRTATAIAVDQVTALEFSMQNFEILLTGNPQLAIRLLRIFSKRIYDSKRRFIMLTLPDLQAKIAYVFMILDETETKIDRSGNSREFQTSIEDIAQWAGLSVPQTKETLSGFASQNRLEMFPNKIIVKNINDFSRLVNSRINQMQ